MERQKYTLGLSIKISIISFLVLLFHAVGLLGFLNTEWQSHFIALVPFHLLLMFALLLVSQQTWNRHFLQFVLLTYLGGYGIEYLGVHTGLIFGSYDYGDTLGTKFADIPLLIGVNWVLLIYSVGTSIEYLNLKNKVLNLLLAAAVLVLLDTLIEPVAIQFDYWSWEGGLIPLQNYAAWFLVSLAGCWFFKRMKFTKQNLFGPVLLLAQFLFFIALNLWA
ncbi:MAG: carotenoid biosynthesis protein [Sphingobacteriaceae bacterium]